MGIKLLFLSILIIEGNVLAHSKTDIARYNYYKSKSDSSYNVGDYENAAIYIDSALSIYPRGNGNYYNSACYWSLFGNIIKAKARLIHAIDLQYFNLESMEKDADLKNLRMETNIWDSIIDYYKVVYSKYESSYDTALRNYLKIIKHNDQLYRYNLDTFQLNSKKQNYLDSLNQIKISYILDSIGYPGQKRVGADLRNVAFLVIQHSPLKIQKKYYNIIVSAADSGELPYSSVALLIDRVRVGSGEKQLYGTQLISTSNGKFEVSPIEDEKNVNERRAKIGLGPLQDYLMNWNVKWESKKNN